MASQQRTDQPGVADDEGRRATEAVELAVLHGNKYAPGNRPMDYYLLMKYRRCEHAVHGNRTEILMSDVSINVFCHCSADGECGWSCSSVINKIIAISFWFCLFTRFASEREHHSRCVRSILFRFEFKSRPIPVVPFRWSMLSSIRLESFYTPELFRMVESGGILSEARASCYRGI